MPRLRAVVSLAPREPGATRAARQLLAHLNRDDLDRLGGLNAGPRRPLVAIVSCRSRLERARLSMNAFQGWNAEPQPVPVIVIGNEWLPDWRFRFLPEERILQLPAPDSYEGLAEKVMTLALVISLLDPSPSMLKVDDDSRPGDGKSLQRTLARMLAAGAPAAGFPITTTSPLDLDRAWHLGRSRRANLRPFDSLGAQRWMSGGVGYLLAGSCVADLGAFALHSWGFVRSMLYEDVCVSMLVEAAGGRPLFLGTADELGIANERQREIEQGLWADARGED
jgi:hypothetical protein